MAERELKISEAEQELKELRDIAQKFPGEMEKAIKDTEKRITEQLTKDFEFDKKLSQQQVQGETKLKDQTIETLKAKIKEQETFIKELTGKATSAETTVKDIAIKALDSSSKIRYAQNEKNAAEKDEQ